MDVHHDDCLQVAGSLRWTLPAFLLFLIFLVLPSTSARAAGTTRFVKQYATGTADCSNWDNACTLQTALAVAVYGDAIWVQQGTHKPTAGTDPNATFNLKSGILLYGGFVGNETSFGSRNWTTHVTTLSGDLGTAHSYHVVSANATDSSTRLDGFTITGGQATPVGGGILVMNNGSLSIANCTITNNSAEDSGGGLYQDGSGRVTVTDSIIQLNEASSNGGGLWVTGDVALTNTQVLSNTAAGFGGGLSTWLGRTDLNGGLFSNNRAFTSNGGAVNVNGSISITNTQFISNTSNDGGGALTQYSPGQRVTITGARFERNTTKNKGGGAYVASPVTITNSSFVTNTVDPGVGTDSFGGGMYAGNTIQVQSSTFSGNRAIGIAPGSSFGGGLAASLTATIQDSTFDGNYAWVGGGVHGDSLIDVTRSSFKNNTGGYGGGIGTESTVQVNGSDFLNNDVMNSGGGIEAGLATVSGTRLIGNHANVAAGLDVDHGLSISNTLFADNTSVNAAAFFAGESASVRHVTIARATWSTAPAISIWKSTLMMTDTIISNYQFAVYREDSTSTVSADYDLISTSTPITPTSITLPVLHNRIGVDPQFANPAAGDYHLTASSPAVDTGTNVGIPVDLDGRRRPLLLGYDMGAYEFGSPVYLPMLVR